MSVPAHLPGLHRNAVIAASAGTGKTHQLTSIFIAHALGLGTGTPVPADRIAATTFSRAAAEEIRERIELRLERIVDPTSDLDRDDVFDPVLRVLAERHRIDRERLRTRAADALLRLPHSLIDTLHGLATQVLRRHAIELGLPPDFRVLEEHEDAEDAALAIEDVLSEVLAQGPPDSELVVRLIEGASGLDKARSSIMGLLSRLAEEGVLPEELVTGGDERAMAQELAALAELCRAIRSEAPNPLAKAAEETSRAIGSGDTAALREALVALAAVKFAGRVKELACFPDLEAFFERLPAKVKRDKVVGFVALLEAAPRLDRDARTLSELLGKIQKKLERTRIARGVFAFGDLLRLARNGLRDRPEVALAARRGIEVLLVDEFQDTSGVQRDLLLLLREEPASIERRVPGTLPRASALASTGLVVVGDRKQSIYGFRGADVSVFARFSAELAGDAAASALDLRGVSANPKPVAEFASLTVNRRSLRGVLEAVNAIATRDFDPAPSRSFEIRYTDAERLSPPDEHGELGRVSVVRDDGATPANVPALLASAEAKLRSAFVAAASAVRLEQEGFRFGEIAVLARRRATLPLVELGLSHYGVPFVVSGRALYDTREVRDVLSVLRLADDPLNRHALAAVLRGPLGGLTDETLVALSSPKTGLLPVESFRTDAIEDAEERSRLELVTDRIRAFKRLAPRLSPRDAVSLAIRTFELDQVLLALPRAGTRMGNLERLMEVAGRRGGSLASFVRFIDRQLRAKADEAEAASFSEEDDAVRLLTVHGSKGLAFPAVIVLDLDSVEQPEHPPLGLCRSEDGTIELIVRQRGSAGPLRPPSVMRAHAELARRAQAERQRLSYVALTRAGRELVVVMPEGKLRPGSLAASVASALDDGSLRALPAVRELDAKTLLETTVALAEEPPLWDDGAAPSPGDLEPRSSLVALAATALADFLLCPRRFRLLHVVGVAEPDRAPFDGERLEEDPRTLGSAAHRVLERWPLERFGHATDAEAVLRELVREGLSAETAETRETALGIASFLSSTYAASLRAPGTSVERELAVITALVSPGFLLKTTFDLAVVRPDGAVEVIDYKRSRGGDAERYSLQLALYRKAAAEHFRSTSVRTGLVHLLCGSREPEWLTPALPDELGERLETLVRCRFTDEWPHVEPAACRVAHCGFLGACHRTGGARRTQRDTKPTREPRASRDSRRRG
jgi:ATP-dependent helicase/nuclease subunit A